MFGRKKPPKNTDSVAFKRYMAEHLDGRHVRYVLEREDNSEKIIGREGFLSVSGDEFIVIGSGKTLFRAKIDTFTAWEFLSLEGAVISGVDLETGKERTVLAYYKFYR